MRSVRDRFGLHGAAAVAIAALLWGTGGLAGSVLARSAGLDGVGIATMRVSVAALALCPFSGSWLLRPRAASRRVRLRHVTGAGILVAVYQVMYFESVRMGGVAVPTMITLGVAPLVVAGASALSARQAPTGTACIGWVAALGGLALTVQGPHVGLGAVQPTAVVLASAAGATYAVVIMLNKRWALHAAGVDLAAVQFAAAAAVLLPLGVATHQHASVSASGVVIALYLGVVATATGYALFFSGLKSVPASTAALMALIEPTAAAILASVFLGEALTLTRCLGVASTLGGLAWLATCDAGACARAP